jgi:hypothetical protein
VSETRKIIYGERNLRDKELTIYELVQGHLGKAY